MALCNMRITNSFYNLNGLCAIIYCCLSAVVCSSAALHTNLLAGMSTLHFTAALFFYGIEESEDCYRVLCVTSCATTLSQNKNTSPTTTT
jgi:hypothetical protein